MSRPELLLPGGASREVEWGRSVRQLLGDGVPADALALTVGGELVDLDAPPPGGGDVRWVTAEHRRASELRQRTAAHALQLALFRLFDEVETVAPRVRADGETFAVDVDLPRSLTPDDFPALEAELARIVDAALPVERLALSAADARAELRRQRSRYRLELLDDAVAAQPAEPAPQHAFVKLGEVIEPTDGARLASTGGLGLVVLQGVAGAYFKGDETRPMLQRLWGGAFADRAAYEAFLERRELAAARDHRKLGPRLGLFALVPEAPALPFWLPRGVVLLTTLRAYLRRVGHEAGYSEVRTPELLPEVHWRTSGHWEHYRERMFVTADEEQSLAVRPMNCPGAILVYKRAERSYRELPLRLMEFGRVHRNERKGTLHGLLRVREFTQDDAHVFCDERDLTAEVAATLRLLTRVYGDLGFDDYRVELSTRPPGALGNERSWRVAEDALGEALREVGLEASTERGAGAFYGPKIDVHVADCLGREWQCGTIQVDFALPERFDLGFVAPEGRSRRPVLIHRAILGSLERFVGVLLEHTGGELPLWLAPEQVRVLPVAEARHADAARRAVLALRSHGVRAELDDRARTLPERIRHAEEELVPLTLILGDDELASARFALRRRGEGDVGHVTLAELLGANDWSGPLAPPVPFDPFVDPESTSP